MFKYLVEEFDGPRPTGKHWQVEAADSIQAAMAAMAVELSGPAKPAQLKAKVRRLRQRKSGLPVFVHLYQLP